MEEGYFQNKQGLRLHYRQWVSDGTAKANLVIVHGYGEHCGRYEDKAAILNAGGYAVHSFDLTGYGKSAGKKAFIPAFAHYLDDLESFLGFKAAAFAGKPLFLMGQSMGGLIVALYAATRTTTAAGMILCSPSLRISDDVSPLLQKLSGVVGALAPMLPILPLETGAFSRDPAIADDYEKDPLVYHGRIRARTGAEIIRGVRAARENMDKIALPLLILHGTADRLCDPRGSRDLYARAASSDKTLRMFEEGYHELFNDLEKKAVMNTIVGWLDRHV
jgi:alpha-beta hydrolase superfamily lysophospholipase